MSLESAGAPHPLELQSQNTPVFAPAMCNWKTEESLHLGCLIGQAAIMSSSI